MDVLENAVTEKNALVEAEAFPQMIESPTKTAPMKLFLRLHI